MKKLLSLVLAMVMVWGLLPVSTPTAKAADSVGLLQLMRGFNVLSGKELTNLNTKNNLLKAGAGNLLADYYDFTTGTETTATAASGKTMEEFAHSEGRDLEIGIDAKIGFGSFYSIDKLLSKLFQASAHVKYNQNEKFSFSRSYESLFYRFSINHTEGKNVIKNFDSADTKRTIQSALNTTFLNDLKNADIPYVFEKYGTHFITSYAMGGWAEYTTTTLVTGETDTSSLKTAYDKSASVNWGLGLTEGITASGKWGENLTEEYKNQDYEHFVNNQTKGGVGGITFSSNEDKVTDTYNNWLKTFTPANSYILLDEHLELRGI